MHPRRAHARSPLAAAAPLPGILAWSIKMHHLGCVSGLAESAEAEELPTSSVPLLCAEMLAKVLLLALRIRA